MSVVVTMNDTQDGSMCSKNLIDVCLVLRQVIVCFCFCFLNWKISGSVSSKY